MELFDAMQSDIVFIGSEEDVVPFASLGIDVYSPGDIEELRRAVTFFVENRWTLIYISDDLLPEVIDIVDRVAADAYPIIASIPGRGGTSSFGKKRLYARVRDAVGINLEALGKK